MRTSSRRHRATLAAVISTLLWAFADVSALTVTSTADAGGTCPGADCTLRQAIATAASGDTINFSLPPNSTIRLTSGQLLIAKDLTITGPGARTLTISGNNASRIFENTVGRTVTISDLTMTEGNSVGVGNGGAVNNTGYLTLQDCALLNNRGGSGGAAGNRGLLTVNNCTFAGNQSTGNGGAVRNTGNLIANNSTFTDNAAASTGAISSFELSGYSPTVILTSCTITGNRADDINDGRGGGVFNGPMSTTTLRNTIVANNTAASGPDIHGSFTSQGFNLVRSSAGATVTPTTGDQIGTPSAANPLIGPLQNNGGPTDTQALLPDSPAIDKGHASGLTTDQRGLARPFDQPVPNASGGDGSDVGAFEVQALGLVANVATRLPVGTGDNVLIEGFIVLGPNGSTKKIIVRALGPFLTQFGVTDALANPTLEIRDGTNLVVATNNDWKSTQVGGIIAANQVSEIQGSGLAPTNDLESAIIANLAPGSYTAVVRGANNGVGTGIVDAYDMSPASPARLANVATRGLIQPGDQLMIAGFIIQQGDVRAVIRAIGPSLSAFGINNALPDTTLQLRDQNGALVRENDDWQSDPAQKQELEATGLQPGNALEAAIVATLPPGQYTAQVRGKPETTGIGVVEVYFLQ